MKLIIIDFNNLLYRSYYGLNQKLVNSQGLSLNAIHGFLKTLGSLLDSNKKNRIVCAMESGTNWRKSLYPEYKNNRSSMPIELKQQQEIIVKLLKTLNIDLIKMDNYEADDVISALAKKHNEYEEIIIVSSDKDLLQLINDSKKIYVLDLMKNVLYNESQAFEKYGFSVDSIPHYLALMGDSSDNVPGARGIGKKIAEKLIKEFKTIDNIYSNLANLTPNLAIKLDDSKKEVDLSLKLIDLRSLNFNIELKNEDLYFSNFIEECQKLELYYIANLFSKYKESYVTK